MNLPFAAILQKPNSEAKSSWFSVTNAVLAGLGLLSLLLYVVGAHNQEKQRLFTFLSCDLGLVPLYFVMAWLVWRARPSRWTFLIGLGFAIVFRLAVIGTPAYLSTDLYRYIWDGRVQAHGINPYRYKPSDPELTFLRDQAIYPHINRKSYARTIYPPVAEGIFFLTTRISETVTWMRATMFLFEIVTVWALARLLASFGLPAQRALIYAWHPLAVWEFAGAGHLDAIMIAFISLALLARRYGKDSLVGLALAAATLIKLFPVILFPAIYRRWGWKMPVTFAAAVLLAYVPYYLTVGPPPPHANAALDFLPNQVDELEDATAAPEPSPAVWKMRVVLGFLPAYADEEGISTGERFYAMTLIPVTFFHAFHISARTGFMALAAFCLAGAAIWTQFRREADGLSFLRRSLALAALFTCLLSPGYCWYLGWLIPFLCFLPGPALFWMTTAICVIYVNWFYGAPHEVYLLNSVTYLPAIALAASTGAILIYRRSRAARILPSLLRGRETGSVKAPPQAAVN